MSFLFCAVKNVQNQLYEYGFDPKNIRFVVLCLLLLELWEKSCKLKGNLFLFVFSKFQSDRKNHKSYN